VGKNEREREGGERVNKEKCRREKLLKSNDLLGLKCFPLPIPLLSFSLSSSFLFFFYYYYFSLES